MLILATTSLPDDTLRQLGIFEAFNFNIPVPHLTKGEEVIAVLKVSVGGAYGWSIRSQDYCMQGSGMFQGADMSRFDQLKGKR